MTKDEWYRNRILWRLSRYNLSSSLWDSFRSENEAAADNIQKYLGQENEPLLVFWRDENLWTVLTTAKLFSVIDGETTTIFIDEIQKRIERTTPSMRWQLMLPRKMDMEFMFVGPNNLRIWAPPGGGYFALMNILRMFPLNVPGANRGHG